MGETKEEVYGPRQILCDMGYEEAVVFENPDYEKAIIGISNEGRVVYDYNKMVECLMEEDNMTSEEAMEFIDYNTLRALCYVSNAPIIMYNLEEF